MTQIRFENITKTFGAVTVIKELGLTIRGGEFFTFVGPSGCGKSTVLNMIAGLEPATEGRIFFDAQLVNNMSPKERDVAMVFQSYALYPHMTVYENIAFPLRMKKQRQEDIDRDVKRVAGLLGLQDFMRKKPKELSGGQRQRVALGRAIVRKPRVFLMDEPLSNLDARLRIETRGELKRLHQELGITTVYVTHDQGEALSLSDRVAVMSEGKIMQCATPLDVYAKPANLFVAGFIGSPPMNVIECTLRSSLLVEIDCRGKTLSPNLERTPERPEVFIGIRPEDIAVSRDKLSDSDFEVTILFTEPTGSFDWADFLWKDVKMKGMAETKAGLLPGSTAHARFSSSKVHVFDARSGERL